MLKIVIVMLSGIALGVTLRHVPIRFVSKLMVVLIWLLLFFLGVEVGSDQSIIGSLQGLGIEAFILTVSGLAGSMAMAYGLWRLVSKKGQQDEE